MCIYWVLSCAEVNMSGEIPMNEKVMEGWTFGTLRYHFDEQLSSIKELIRTLDVTKQTAMDKAFEAQTTAMSTAFLAAEKISETKIVDQARMLQRQIDDNNE